MDIHRIHTIDINRIRTKSRPSAPASFKGPEAPGDSARNWVKFRDESGNSFTVEPSTTRPRHQSVTLIAHGPIKGATCLRRQTGRKQTNQKSKLFHGFKYLFKNS